MPEESKEEVQRQMRKASFILNLFMANFASHSLVVALVIFSPAIKSTLGLSYVQISAIFFAMVFGDQVGRAVAIRIRHNVSVYRMLFVGSLLAISGAIVLSFSTVSSLLAFGASMVLMARAFTSSATESLAPFGPSLAVRYGGVFSMFMSAILIAFFVEWGAYWQMGIFLLMPLSLIVVIMNRPYLSGNQNLPREVKSWAQLYPYLQNTCVIGCILLFITLRILSNVSLLWLPLFTVDGIGTDIFNLAMVVIFWFLLFGCARAFMSLLLRFFKPMMVFTVAAIFSIVGLLISFLIAPYFLYILSINGLAIGLFLPLFYKILEDRFGADMFSILQLAFLPAALFDMLLHLLIGKIAYLHGIGVGFLFIPILGTFTLALGFFLFHKNKEVLAPQQAISS